MNKFHNLSEAIQETQDEMEEHGYSVHTERWQARDISGRPDARMVEILHWSFMAPIPQTPDELALQVAPNLPWAEDHFMERVCGAPVNPGIEWRNWPWSNFADEHREDEMFNHNYMERYWPKLAGLAPKPTHTPEQFLKAVEGRTFVENMLDTGRVNVESHRGIRHEYGDLAGVIRVLSKEPLTRQAYLPVWFPEDTGDSHTGRKPCTIGYQFIMRDNKLDVVYHIRSCDFFRHFRDDIYLTARLGQAILAECRARNPEQWGRVEMGSLVMHITNLHMFINDYLTLFKHMPIGCK